MSQAPYNYNTGIAGMFSQLSQVRTNQGGLYFQEGNFVVEIEAIKISQNKDFIPTFIVETKVLQSDNPALRPGMTPAQIITIKQTDLATHLGNVKAFVAKVFGMTDPDTYCPPEAAALDGAYRQAAIDAWWQRAIMFVSSEAQPCKGYYMPLSCTTVITKKTKAPFTKHNWGTPISTPQTRAQQGQQG